MTPNALILIADGCEETEAVTVYDLLIRAGINVTLASTNSTTTAPPFLIKCSRGIHIIADTDIHQIQNTPFDIVILPGGLQGANHLRDNPNVINLIKKIHTDGGIAAAICASPAFVFAHHQLFPEAQMTGYPETETLFNEGQYSHVRVCYDDQYRVLTSQGPGTSIDFGLKIIELLAGSQKAGEIAEQLILPSGICHYGR